MMTHATRVALTHTPHTHTLTLSPSLPLFLTHTFECLLHWHSREPTGSAHFQIINLKFVTCVLIGRDCRTKRVCPVRWDSNLPTPPTACTQLWALPPKMQMNDATEPLKIIIGAAVTTAAQRKIYFLIFNGVNAYRKTEKRKTKKQKAMQMQLSAEQNVFEMKSLRNGAARREASGNGNRYQHFASISISYILLIYIQFSVFFWGGRNFCIAVTVSSGLL